MYLVCRLLLEKKKEKEIRAKVLKQNTFRQAQQGHVQTGAGTTGALRNGAAALPFPPALPCLVGLLLLHIPSIVLTAAASWAS